MTNKAFTPSALRNGKSFIAHGWFCLEGKSPTIIFFLCTSLIGRSIIRRDPNYFLCGSFSFGAYASERIPTPGEGSDSFFANRIG
jgi:hypothetical protein